MASAAMCAGLTFAIFASAFAGEPLDRGFLRAAPAVRPEAIEADLLSELAGQAPGSGAEAQRGHVEDLEALVRPMFTALPKNEHGRLGHAAVRYLLHRLFMQRFSWFVRGLEPEVATGDASAAVKRFWDQPRKTALAALDAANFTLDSTPIWPSFLQGDLEHMRKNRGLSLRDVAVVAAALEDLVHRDTRNRLSMAYDARDLATNVSLDEKDTLDVLKEYILLYIAGWSMGALTHEAIENTEMRYFGGVRWNNRIEPLVRDAQAYAIESNNISASSANFTDVAAMAEQVGRSFSSMWNPDCHGLKSTLLSFETRKLGRVRLSDFYNHSRFSHWAFMEKIEYLRTLGALDEQNESNPLVIIPNYVTSMPQCLKASGLYTICCPNECEAVIATMEGAIAAPEASPERLIKLVESLLTDTVTSPRVLSRRLKERLQEVADHHGGLVPIHGRLFAQWLHHAFPRECPYPHEAGTTSPLTPDEWIKESGHSDSQATEEEMRRHIRPDDGCSLARDPSTSEEDEEQSWLPWNPREELLHAASPVIDASSVLGAEAEMGILLEQVDDRAVASSGVSIRAVFQACASATSLAGLLAVAVAGVRTLVLLSPSRKVASSSPLACV